MRNDELTYDWLDFLAEQKSVRKNLFKEETVRDFVGKNVAKTAQAVGALNLNFQKGAGDSIQLDPSWTSQNIELITLHDGQKISFNKKYSNALFNAFKNACEAAKAAGKPYCPRNNGAYNPRTMRGKQNISNHSFGTAIDFETATTQKEIANHPEFVAAFKKGHEGVTFTWGGDWRGLSYDPMHFEVNLTGVSAPSTTSPAASSTTSPAASSSFLGSLIREQKEKKLFNIVDQTDKKIYSKYKKYFDSLLKHLKQELKIDKPVKIILEEDKKNGNKVLGRTGGYINQEIKIHIFCTDRHIKDILRSLAHEMVHHHQNLRGEFKDKEPTTKGYAQTNKHLRKMEEEAYLKGNILFRDWEDNYKYRGEK